MSAVSDKYGTPFVACLLYRGYAFAWFYDSNLAIRVANELLAVGLCANCNVYHSVVFNGFDLETLRNQPNWQFNNVHGKKFFLCFHRSIRRSESKTICITIENVIKKFQDYETMYY